MPDFPDVAYFEIAPDWACEMLAPATRCIDQCEKRSIYAREGVSHLWFVDPEIKMLEVFKLHNGQWLLLDTLVDDALVTQPPSDAISFPLDMLWPQAAEMRDGGEEESG
ncbi:MAG: Uma2 family endonuclease [Rhodobacteraceae bacterium]|nr:Uma2 family endonuclease [Paracoccaceae bacterium]